GAHPEHRRDVPDGLRNAEGGVSGDAVSGYIGVDFDGTLVVHESGAASAGRAPNQPIPEMVERVKKWLAAGEEVRIITARVAPVYDDNVSQTVIIQKWCEEHLGRRLRVQAYKCGSMIQLWDDRAVQLVPNTGLRA